MSRWRRLGGVVQRLSAVRSACKKAALTAAEAGHHWWTQVMTSPFRLAALVFLTSVLVFYGLGSLISYHFYRHGELTRIFDRQEQPIAPFVYLIAIPALAYVHVWQPGRVDRLFRELRQNKVFGQVRHRCLAHFIRRIGCSSHPVTQYDHFLYIAALWLRRWVRVVVAAVLIGGLVYWQVSAPQIRQTPPYWWHIDKSYYYAVWLPLMVGVWFALLISIFRALLTALLVSAAILTFEIRVDPYHPDGAGGLRPVGDFVLSHFLAALLAISVPFFLAFARMDGPWFRLDATSLGLWATYLVGVPFFFGMPFWAAHRSMIRERARDMVQLTRRLAEHAPPANSRAVQTLHLHIGYLYWSRRLEDVARTFPTWPVPNLGPRGLVTASTIAVSLGGSLASLATLVS